MLNNASVARQKLFPSLLLYVVFSLAVVLYCIGDKDHIYALFI